MSSKAPRAPSLAWSGRRPDREVLRDDERRARSSNPVGLASSIRAGVLLVERATIRSSRRPTRTSFRREPGPWSSSSAPVTQRRACPRPVSARGAPSMRRRSTRSSRRPEGRIAALARVLDAPLFHVVLPAWAVFATDGGPPSGTSVGLSVTRTAPPHRGRHPPRLGSLWPQPSRSEGLALPPAAAQAGVGPSVTPTFPRTPRRSDGAACGADDHHANEGTDVSATICNSGDAAPCWLNGEGITLMGSCAAQAATPPAPRPFPVSSRSARPPPVSPPRHALAWRRGLVGQRSVREGAVHARGRREGDPADAGRNMRDPASPSMSSRPR